MDGIEVLDGDAAPEHADAIFALYDQVFGRIPDRGRWQEQLFDRHRVREGYRLAVKYADDGRLAGFAWGYVGQRGQFWPDLVARNLPELPGEWIGGHFELVELAVEPGSRRAGIGGALHDAVLEGLTGRALLGATITRDDPALCLYRSRGWSTLGRMEGDRQVMGAHLPLPS